MPLTPLVSECFPSALHSTPAPVAGGGKAADTLVSDCLFCSSEVNESSGIRAASWAEAARCLTHGPSPPLELDDDVPDDDDSSSSFSSSLSFLGNATCDSGKSPRGTLHPLRPHFLW